MRVYRALWLSVCTSLAIVGVSAAVVLAPTTHAPRFVLLAIVGAAVSLLAARWTGQRPLRCRPRLNLCSALVGAAAACAIGGLAVLWDVAVVLPVVVVALSSPAVLRACNRWLNSPADPSTTQLDGWGREFVCVSHMPGDRPDAPAIGDLTNMQLCRAWRGSGWALRNPSSLLQATATVVERQRLLDEFERRNASGFAAWLGSDVRELGNPLPYLIGSRSDAPTINWDELTRLQD